jgi:hypothetical protein
MTGSIKLREISIMAKFSEQRRNHPRRDRWFRPVIDEASTGGSPLDRRLLLSAGLRGPERLTVHVVHQAARASHHAKAGQPHGQRLTPTEKINAEYNAFLTAFDQQLASYIGSLNQTSTGKSTVSATVTAAYAAGSPTIQVDDAAVFGPAGTFSTPVLATATIGSAPPIGSFTLTGSAGNSLIVNPANSSSIPMSVGTVLSATVAVSASNSALSIFPSYITTSTISMGDNLVEYFNNLPLKLPQENGPPHTPIQRGAIQKYVYMSVAGNGITFGSLQQSLLAIPLPATPGSDLDIYNATVNSVVAQSRQQVLDGIQQIYARKLLISADAPANRLGEILNTGSTSGGGTSSTHA